MVLDNLQPYIKQTTSIFGTFATNNYSKLNFMGRAFCDHTKKKKILFVDEQKNDQMECEKVLKQYFESVDVYPMHQDIPFMVQFDATNFKKQLQNNK